MPAWERLFKQARKDKPLHGDRWAVTETDFAQAVVLLRFFTENRNPDGSLPQRRVQELWTVLYERGDFSRPWNHHSWKAIRDWMSQMGWLDWQDHRYQIGTGHGDGRACRWRLHEDFVQRSRLAGTASWRRRGILCGHWCNHKGARTGSCSPPLLVQAGRGGFILAGGGKSLRKPVCGVNHGRKAAGTVRPSPKS